MQAFPQAPAPFMGPAAAAVSASLPLCVWARACPAAPGPPASCPWFSQPRASPWRLHSAGTTGAAGASERCSPSVSFSHRAPFDGTTIQSPRVSKAQTHSGSSPAPLVVPVPLVNSGGPPSESPSGPCRFSGVGPLSAAAWADAVAAWSLASASTVLLQPSPFLAVTSLDTYSTLQPAVCHSLTIANPRLFVFILILPWSHHPPTHPPCPSLPLAFSFNNLSPAQVPSLYFL